MKKICTSGAHIEIMLNYVAEMIYFSNFQKLKRNQGICQPLRILAPSRRLFGCQPVGIQFQAIFQPLGVSPPSPVSWQGVSRFHCEHAHLLNCRAPPWHFLHKNTFTYKPMCNSPQHTAIMFLCVDHGLDSMFPGLTVIAGTSIMFVMFMATLFHQTEIFLMSCASF